MWVVVALLLVGCGAVAVYTAPARARRHGAERDAVMRALAGLRPSGTAGDVARVVEARTGRALSTRVAAAHLVGLEEDGLAASATPSSARQPPRYRLLVEPPPGTAAIDPPATTIGPPTVPSGAPCLTVYHDGACPLCAAEIALYRRAGSAAGIAFVDAAAPGDGPAPDLARAAALARFHVRAADGELVSGAAAFARLWQALPGWAWLGRLVAAPTVLPLAESAYRAFLPLRPYLARALVALRLVPPVPGGLAARRGPGALDGARASERTD